MRILALFDDAAQSVKTALPEYEVVSIGLNDKPTVFKLDLSDLGSVKTILQMHQQKPFDLIMASPPCESWSFATASGGGNAYRFSGSLKLKNFDEWQQNTFNNIRRMVEKQNPELPEKFMRYFETGVNGEKTAFVTAQIIQKLGLPFVIENPSSSMIWRYFEMLGLRFINNKTNYCAYDETFSAKPTTFASNCILNLKTGKSNVIMKNLKGRGDGSERANIPKALIVDIVKQIQAV